MGTNVPDRGARTAAALAYLRSPLTRTAAFSRSYLRAIRQLTSLSCLCVLPTLAASFSASIGFPSAPESQGCSKNRTDNQTAVCFASLNDTQGTSLVSLYQDGANRYVVLGTIQVTRPESSTTTVKASLSATLTEFNNLTSGGVRLTNNCTQDCEPITVTVNGIQVGVLSGAQSLCVPYAQQDFQIQLSAEQVTVVAGIDYVGAFNITASTYE
jgi:hypothetical protein